MRALMVFPIPSHRHCLGQRLYNHEQLQQRSTLKLYRPRVRDAYQERVLAAKRRLTSPFQSPTTCGPRKHAGRFRRILTESSLPPSQSANDTHAQNLSSHAKPSSLNSGWVPLLLAALACCILPRLLSPPRQQQQLTRGQAAVAMISETPSASSSAQQPASMPGQQQAFASISAASFASLFSGAQRARLAQILVYQAQRVRFLIRINPLCRH